MTSTDKVIRLVEYLARLASLRTKIIRDVSEYQNVLWINDIPKLKGCFSQSWGSDEDFDSDVWIEIQAQHEPELPRVPSVCREWIHKESLRTKNKRPSLLSEITRRVEDFAWQEADQPKFITRIERLADHPDVQKAWEEYVDRDWLPWVQAHNEWESVHKVYARLFAIRQEQLRLGEEYELVLALGLLNWKTPSNQYIHRHLIVANAVLEFEAQLGRFTIRPLPDGANVRPELDMLDIAEQPPRAEESAKASLANAGDNPWNKDCIEGTLQALVHSINPQGDYYSTLDSTGVQASDKPIAEYTPALILRKRSARDLTQTLKRIKERIQNGDGIPEQFEDLAEIRSGRDGPQEIDPDETRNDFSGEVFFPKPANKEQRRIVERIQTATGVLVQGPPGTGKSHTIANLICHLLATGQRILITAKTPRALRVLEELVPKELRSLCINLLGSGLEEKKSLETSISRILRKEEEWSEDDAQSEIVALEQKLRFLREEKVKVDRRLRDIRESETHFHSVAEGTYQGTAACIAISVNQNRSVYDWFTDISPLDKTCPVSERELRRLLVQLRYFSQEKRQELELAWPDKLPPIEQFANRVDSEQRANRECEQSSNGADKQIAEALSGVAASVVKAIQNSLAAFSDLRSRLLTSRYSWMREALHDIVGGKASTWRIRHDMTQATISIIEPLISIADETNIDFPEDANIRMLFEGACKLKKHMENGGKLGWGPFRPKVAKEHIQVLKIVRIDGTPCSNLRHLSVAADILRLRIECEKAWGFWVGIHEQTQGPYTLQFQALKDLVKFLADALSLEKRLDDCRELLKQCPVLRIPAWTDEAQIERLIASCRFTLANRARHLAEGKIRSIEESVESLGVKKKSHNVTNQVIQAIHKRDVGEYGRVRDAIQALEDERQKVRKLDEDIEYMRQLVPRLTDEIQHTCENEHWTERVEHINDAWRWSQARFWVDEYIKEEDAPSLAIRACQIEDEINEIIGELAALHAWSFCFSRLKENHRRHMLAWQQSMRLLGKGTGKHAPRHRRDAQRHLSQCREAVPAWVMPVHRVWDTVDPAPAMFDVVIVDEASQCGPETLPLFYLGKKVLIVGDDKQISPDAVGLSRDAVHHLMGEFLHDFHFQSSFNVESSLFDHGKLRYGTQRITLREHFRCMPEIIRFSNDLCYSDTPLIPLRQYGPDRLVPLEHIFVNGGYREGSQNRVVNRVEADAIVKKIIELCSEQRYAGKTMGVIVLQGEAQAGLIEGKLLEQLGAEEMEQRRLVCGNPYSFQGDEREVMFLSMVAAINERIGPLTKPADERRFNVAASRARDQLFLFHSVTTDNLSTSCLRRRLLEFFEHTTPHKIAGIERDVLERRTAQDNRAAIRPPKPFESWFEVDVALELARKNLNVCPQYELAGRRIDLVIEGGQARLAVECDGDAWHGVEQYEKDMDRQRQLERCGWAFFRVRASAFYANKDVALEGLWRALEERGILTSASGSNQRFALEKDMNEDKYDEAVRKWWESWDCLNVDLTPEMFREALDHSLFCIRDEGVRQFITFSQIMVKEFGQRIKPYLLDFYRAVRAYPGLDNTGMSTDEKLKREVASWDEDDCDEGY